MSPGTGRSAQGGINNLAVVFRFAFASLLLTSSLLIPCASASSGDALAHHNGGQRHAIVGGYRHRHKLHKWRELLVGAETRELHAYQRPVEKVLIQEEEHVKHIVVDDVVIHTGRRLWSRNPMPKKGSQPPATSPVQSTEPSTTQNQQSSTPTPSPKGSSHQQSEPGCYSLDDPHCPGNDRCCPDTNPICAISSNGDYLCIPDSNAKKTSSSPVSTPANSNTKTTSSAAPTTTTRSTARSTAQPTTTSISTTQTSTTATTSTTTSTLPTTLATQTTTSKLGTATAHATSSFAAQPTGTSSTQNSYNQSNSGKTPIISGIVAGTIVTVVLGALVIKIIISKRKERKGMKRIPSATEPLAKEEAGIPPPEPAVLAGGARPRPREMMEYRGGHDASGPQYRYAADGHPLTPPSPPPSALPFPRHAGSPSHEPIEMAAQKTPTMPSPLSAGYNHNLYNQRMYDEDAQYFNDNHAPPLQSPRVQTYEVGYMYPSQIQVPSVPSGSQASAPNPNSPSVMRMPTVLRVGETKGRGSRGSFNTARGTRIHDEIFFSEDV